MNQPADHLAAVPGGSLYYRTRGHGPALLLMGGGPSNADTLEPLATRLAEDFTVVTYDRRGYSRSQAGDPSGLAGIPRHADDARRLIADLGFGTVAVFGTSFGALIALELAAAVPAAVTALVVHEPPLGELLADGERQPFDLNLGAEQNAEAALNSIAASVGARRGHPPAGGVRGPAPADVELFIRRDAPAIGDYHLDLGRLRPLAGRLIVTGSEESRDFYPYQCARRLAELTGAPFNELPGNHAGMIARPAEFAAGLAARLKGVTNDLPHQAASPLAARPA